MIFILRNPKVRQQYRVVSIGLNGKMLHDTENLSSKAAARKNIHADLSANYPDSKSVTFQDNCGRKPVQYKMFQDGSTMEWSRNKEQIVKYKF